MFSYYENLFKFTEDIKTVTTRVFTTSENYFHVGGVKNTLTHILFPLTLLLTH